ncbi:hypothetical protein [Algoriphagus chordae]|uniref:Uncharacterized protein n=1 Tax=Algoriphagus chordae TaxID=237019 RepID=A0A2W7R426_9BACT|nr:hypothetical protein [Algoriphagus chordae]PZX55583.1 hypothetical protein LV85_00808 [Algoriphagus chordae]
MDCGYLDFPSYLEETNIDILIESLLTITIGIMGSDFSTVFGNKSIDIAYKQSHIKEAPFL